MQILYILKKLQLYNQNLTMKMAINRNQMRKTHQIFGCVYSWIDNTLKSQLNISLKMHLRKLLDSLRISMDILQYLFVFRMFTYMAYFNANGVMYLRCTFVMYCTMLYRLFETLKVP